MNIPDHSVIQNRMRTGHPDGREPVEPVCPVCGEAAEVFYTNKTFRIVGCCCCLTETEYFEIEV